MATITLSSSFDFTQPQDWDWVLSDSSPTFITITDGVHEQTFTGSFTFGANDSVSGTATGSTYSVNGNLVYTITGMSKSASTLADFATTLGDTQATYAYVLSGNDTFIGSDGDDVLLGYAGNDVFDGGDGADTLRGGVGNDTYTVDGADTVIEEAGEGIDLIRASQNYQLGANLENLTLIGSGNIEGKGNSLANVITGNNGNNKLDGVGGADTLIGGAGDDQYVVDLTLSNALEDKIVELAGEGIDTLTLTSIYSNTRVTTLTLAANLENLDARDTGSLKLNLTGNAANNIIQGNDADNTLNGGLGADTLAGGLGDDTYLVDNAGDVIEEDVGEGNDTVRVGIATVGGLYTLGDHLENAILTSTVAFDLTGNDLVNTLTGNGAANRIDGGAGADLMIGGAGNDTYVVDDIGDSITDSAGIDTVETSLNYTLADKPTLENIRLTGNQSSIATGNALANVLDGSQSSASNLLFGGKGNDTYIIGSGDGIVEGLNEGTDLVQATVSYSLGSYLENLTLIGSDNIDGTGNELKNIITGNQGNNVLDGGSAVDSLIGGAGDDTYVVDLLAKGGGSSATVALEDSITEKVGEGTDSLKLRADGLFGFSGLAALTLGANLENLDASDTGNLAINLTGNAAANVLTGSDGANILDGKAGIDTLIGGLGDDTYVVDSVSELGLIQELEDEGVDSLRVTYLNSGPQVQTINLNDPSLQYIDNLSVLGTGLFNLTGNDLDNVLIGNASANTLIGGLGNDTLDGKKGADTLIGGDGDDTYYVYSNLDQVQETLTGGTDTVNVMAYAGNTYTLGANIENAVVLASGTFNLLGNALDNTLTGNAGANRIDGGVGADLMQGGAGNDTYIVDNVNDQVLDSGGIDTVESSVDFSLDLQSGVDNLVLTGSGNIDGEGNALANTLTGNSGNNDLDGLGGVDTLKGGLGDDRYRVALTAKNLLEDSVIELVDQGNDSVELYGGTTGLATVTITLGANLENLDATDTGTLAINLTGNAAANVLTGSDGANILDGKAGIDTLIGGLGNDTYVVDSAAELGLIQELQNEGVDTLRVTYLNSGTQAQTINLNDPSLQYIDNLSVLGTGLFNLTGNDLDNVLIGNASANTLIGGLGNDTLDGKKGADTLIGGDGDDTYYVYSNLDQVQEALNGGTDTVNVMAYAGNSYTLVDNIENAVVLASGTFNLVGNALDNTLTGNAGANRIDGGLGADLMQGGAGNDTYIVDNVNDLVLDSAGIDTIETSVSYSLGLQSGVDNLVLTGSGNIDGEGNALANTLTGNSGNNDLDGLGGVDTLKGGLGDDRYRVGLTAQNLLEDSVIELVDQGNDSVELYGGTTGLATVTITLGANLENLDATDTGTLAINLTGNAAANILIGSDGANILDGKAGIDTLIGGLGDDTYVVDSVSELGLIQELEDEGVDSLRVTYLNSGPQVQTINLNDPSLQYIDNLSVLGTGLFNLTGNALDNLLIGNASANTLIGGLGNDTLDGKKGADTLIGGDGDDTYYVYSNLDQVQETLTGGTDTVNVMAYAGNSYTLVGNIENAVVLASGAFNLVGNDLDNVLTGNAGNNRIDGGLGADLMQGGAGNDTYIVDNINDQVLDSGGIDTIETSVSYSLDLQSGVDNLVLTGTGDIYGEGNSLANIITGNSGDNFLDGYGGADTLKGGFGDDYYVVDLTAKNQLEDQVIELAGQGIDSVEVYGGTAGLAAVTITLAANVENLNVSSTEAGVKLNLTGNALNNVLIGNTAQNVFTGGAGADTFVFDNLAQLGTVSDSTTWDTISDFKSGIDHIDLSGLGTSFELIASNADFTGAGQLKLLGGVLYGTVDGGAAADFAIKLTGVNSIALSDIYYAVPD
ncbi:calcium-binding protein [Pseudomonas morbosilactucae]|uniref:calcium-binding protein n=1 Tax=Pseudomonas morbosilactucae TaxID=2938197 RepID=UPI0024472DA9|nr:calcium-binding protein [Pseudomonas morbosilactucae]